MASKMEGRGQAAVPGTPAAVAAALLDPAVLHALIPGAQEVRLVSEGRYRALLSYGVGKLRGNYTVDLTVTEGPGGVLALGGRSAGPFGGGAATAQVELQPGAVGTVIGWTYAGEITGLYAFVPAAMLRAAAERFIGRFFTALGSRVAG